MFEFFDLMILPFIACLILTGIHAYLGLHVIERGVIFVDLALAQIAALGATVGYILGYGLHSNGSYFIALGFTFIGAVIFSATRFRKPRVPHEAIIGIVYAVCASAVILILSRAPEGGEELKSLLVGHLLFVQPSELIKMGVIYSVIGLLHYFFRKPLLLISQDVHQAFEKGLKVRLWDFFFYITFGFVVTSSVEIGGILLVFAFLVVPSVCAAWLFEGVGRRLSFGWILGVLTSIAGIVASYYLDLPTGAAIVCTFGVTLILCAFAGLFLKKQV